MEVLRNERGVIASWLAKTVLAFAIAGVVLFDAGVMVWNVFGLQGTADDIAASLSASIAAKELAVGGYIACYPQSQTPLCVAARAQAKEQKARLVTAEMDTQGVLHVTVRRTVDTLVASRIGAIEDWAKATAEASANTQ